MRERQSETGEYWIVLWKEMPPLSAPFLPSFLLWLPSFLPSLLACLLASFPPSYLFYLTMCLFMYVCMYVFMYVCIYVYIYASVLNTHRSFPHKSCLPANSHALQHMVLVLTRISFGSRVLHRLVMKAWRKVRGETIMRDLNLSKQNKK